MVSSLGMRRGPRGPPPLVRELPRADYARRPSSRSQAFWESTARLASGLFLAQSSQVAWARARIFRSSSSFHYTMVTPPFCLSSATTRMSSTDTRSTWSQVHSRAELSRMTLMSSGRAFQAFMLTAKSCTGMEWKPG